jgi:hypothetical protein
MKIATPPREPDARRYSMAIYPGKFREMGDTGSQVSCMHSTSGLWVEIIRDTLNRLKPAMLMLPTCNLLNCILLCCACFDFPRLSDPTVRYILPCVLPLPPPTCPPCCATCPTRRPMLCPILHCAVQSTFASFPSPSPIVCSMLFTIPGGMMLVLFPGVASLAPMPVSWLQVG